MLLHSLHAHRKKDTHPILHKGLILLIENYSKTKAIVASPYSKRKKGSASDSQVKKSKGDEGYNAKKKLEIMDTPQKNEEEITKSSDKNEGKNEEFGEETKMGDISSNLEGYPGCKDKTGKNEVEGSGEKK